MNQAKGDKADNIEDIYPLSPMQQGLLFETLSGSDSGTQHYAVQCRFEIEGPLDVQRFRESWQAVARRHPVLRSAFVHEQVSKPVQVVLNDRSVPFRHLSGEGNRSVDGIAQEELERGFDVQHDPLLRITLVRTGREKHQMIWTHHHLIMDGWCLSVIERDLFEYYRAGLEGRPPELPAIEPYSRYIRWLQERDSKKSLRYWKEYLRGFKTVSPAAALSVRETGRKPGIRSSDFILPDDLTGRLRSLSRQTGVTLNTVMQTAWGCLLALACGRDDVVVGCIVSGRPAHLEGAREMVGVFINAIPVRFTIGRTDSFRDLAQRRQGEYGGSEDHHHIPLAEITGASGHRQLFDHLFGFENYPVNPEEEESHGLEIRQLDARDVSHYPFGIKVTHRDRLHIQLSWNRKRYTEERVRQIYGDYLALLEEACGNPDGAIRESSFRPSLSPPDDGPRADSVPADHLPPEHSSPSPGRDRPSPHPETLAALRSIWEEVLELKEISEEDNFFVIGGHSLKAMQVVSRIQKQMQADITIEDVFSYPTLSGMAAHVARSGSAGENAIPEAPGQESYPLSHAQKRLWLQHNIDAETAYNMPLTYLVREPLEADLLREAFRQLIRRHEVLRTAFLSGGEEPRQVICEEAEADLVFRDYRESDDPLERARRDCEEEAAVPFNLEEPPLLRILLIRTGEKEFVLQLCIHHIIGDGWSMRVLFNELSRLYEACATGGEADLPPLRIQYRDFTMWQMGQEYDGMREFWMEYLRGAPEKVHLPYNSEPERQSRFTGRHTGTELSSEVTGKLRELSRRRKTTLSNLVLSLFLLLLHRLSGQDDLCVGISVAGRNDRELERMIGFFVNILPLRVKIEKNMDFEELFSAVIQSAGKVYARQEYPFDKLIRELNPERAGNRQPLTNVVYGYQNFADVRIDEDRSSGAGKALQHVESFPLTNRTAKFDLTLFAYELDDRLRLDLEYDSDLFEASTARAFLNTLVDFSATAAESASMKTKSKPS